MIKQVLIIGLIISSVILTAFLLLKEPEQNQYDERPLTILPVEVEYITHNNNQGTTSSTESSSELLKLKLESQDKYIQLDSHNVQIIPCVVSVQANDTIDSKELLTNRKGIDLVVVFDNSGSMSGDKIKNLKSTTEFLIDLLDERDRLSIITFNSYATVIQPLVFMGETNKKISYSEVSKIKTEGGTNISSGMKEAFSILQSREKQNYITSIFLLSDGQDNESRVTVQDLLKKEYERLQAQSFTIHSFGYGVDHDHLLLSQISSLKDGNFYYVKNAQEIDEYFANALGGLFSVAAQNITIDVKLSKENNELELGGYISKTYGNDWIEVEKGRHYRIKINQLINTLSKDFVFEMLIPFQSLENQQRIVNTNYSIHSLLQANLQATPVQQHLSSQIINLNESLEVRLFTEKEKVPEELRETNQNTEYHYWRVKSSDAILEAIRFNNAGDYTRSKKQLKQVQEEMEKLKPETKKKLESVIEDINVSYDLSGSDTYTAGANIHLYSISTSNTKQYTQSVGRASSSGYSNSLQNEMIKERKQHKKSKNEL